VFESPVQQTGVRGAETLEAAIESEMNSPNDAVPFSVPCAFSMLSAAVHVYFLFQEIVNHGGNQGALQHIGRQHREHHGHG
jgi:hypothetical protein